MKNLLIVLLAFGLIGCNLSSHDYCDRLSVEWITFELSDDTCDLTQDEVRGWIDFLVETWTRELDVEEYEVLQVLEGTHVWYWDQMKIECGGISDLRSCVWLGYQTIHGATVAKPGENITPIGWAEITFKHEASHIILSRLAGLHDLTSSHNAMAKADPILWSNL